MPTNMSAGSLSQGNSVNLCGIIHVCKINIGITAIAKVETETLTSIKRAI